MSDEGLKKERVEYVLLSSGLWKAELEPCVDGAIVAADATDVVVVDGVKKLLLLILLASPYNELG